MSGKKRVAVLISGRGSNMEALIEAAQAADYPADIVGVISNKSSAVGLRTAQNAGIDTAVFSLKDYTGKAEADAAISEQLNQWGVDIVCLAGFMRLMGPDFCESWRGRLINIHPSLLPAYKGLDTHKRALDDHATEHGCTVHFVTSDMDEGPVIGQVVVPVLLGDTPAILADRVLKAEHKLYPMALKQIATGEITFY